MEVLRARFAAPRAQVGAVLAPRALAADDVPDRGGQAVAHLLLEARARPQQREVVPVPERMRPARRLRREPGRPLEPRVERHQESVADVGVRLAEVHVHRGRRHVAGDLHERRRVHRASARQDEPAGRLEPRLRVLGAEGVRHADGAFALDALRLAARDAPRPHDGRRLLAPRAARREKRGRGGCGKQGCGGEAEHRGPRYFTRQAAVPHCGSLRRRVSPEREGFGAPKSGSSSRLPRPGTSSSVSTAPSNVLATRR